MSAVLVIGGGGREHAIARSLAISPKVSRVHVAPGNGGTRGGKVSSVSLGAKNYDAIVKYCADNEVAVVVVGPEAPLADGIADHLKCHGVRCFGPSKKAAIIESSKAWSKDFCVRHSIPTARYKNFTEIGDAERHVDSVDYEVVVKASGLAAGKGVFMPATKAEARDALRSLMVDRKFGIAGAEVVVEEKLEGLEASVLAFTDGHSFVCCPAAQDHKRIGDGDRGLNTGGMGAYCPSPVSPADMSAIHGAVIKPAIDGLRREGRPFVGVLSAGLMLTADGPKVMEFNCRMGDPEAQVVLPLLATDLFDIVVACCDGHLDSVDVKFSDQFACSVVAASRGYPESCPKGKIISGIGDVAGTDTIVYHAGTRLDNDRLVTSGGRVFAVTGLGDDMRGAIEAAYSGMAKICFDGMQFRGDIARRALEEEGRATYAAAGVDVAVGDSASRLAYAAALSTFSSRRGMIGEPVALEGGFTGLLDMGDFYLAQGDDGVGTKAQIAELLGTYDTLGYDLLAMVCDDAVCLGAETISVSNTIDTSKVEPRVIGELVEGLAAACAKHKIVIPGGEVAELGPLVRGLVWNATAVGVLAKCALIDGSAVAIGDVVISLEERGFRSNGFTLARHILARKYESEGEAMQKEVHPRGAGTSETFGSALLRPSTIYSSAVLELIGRYEDRDRLDEKISVKGIAHITGGGLPGNLSRVLQRTGLSAHLDKLHPPGSAMVALQSLGNVRDKEAYRTWCMGNGMLLIVSPSDADAAAASLAASGIVATIAGRVTATKGGSGGKITLVSRGAERPGDVLEFEAREQTARHGV
uniref:ATP-grasp domain-containing protein n=1 Tax=Marseillevirus LCMAC103 TaxID=2506604 RepID=A0A481YUM5_9VIRU|nr:MAG: uncharacterized protein LCMAC103_01310 [Marseillevirus LCMAC103]